MPGPESTASYLSGSLFARPSGGQHQQGSALTGATPSVVLWSKYGHFCSCNLPLPCCLLPNASWPHTLPCSTRLSGLAALGYNGRCPGAVHFDTLPTSLSTDPVPRQRSHSEGQILLGSAAVRCPTTHAPPSPQAYPTSASTTGKQVRGMGALGKPVGLLGGQHQKGSALTGAMLFVV